MGAFLPHWPEYLIEAALLGLFMVSACSAVVVMEHPASPVQAAIRSGVARRSVIGVLMGLTAIALIYSPLGQRSGAHMNPGTTLTFLALGKVSPTDAAFYIAAQFIGGVCGVGTARAVWGIPVAHERVNYAATVPGPRGLRTAWVTEFAMSLGLMGMVLVSSNTAAAAPYTGLFAGAMVAAYIGVLAPLSGMSMNPARTLGSALPARAFRGLWVYFTAPPLGMFAAAAIYVALAGRERVYCAKLDHRGEHRCIFHCRIDEMPHRR